MLSRRIENLKVERSKELLRLELNCVPRRIAEHDVEALPSVGNAGRVEDFGERQIVG